MVDGTYRGERNPQQRISFGWWYLSERKEPSKEDFIWLVVLIGENGTLNRGFHLVGGTYRGEWNPQHRISFGWWHLSQRMEPSKEDIVWLMVLIGEKGTINRGFCLVGGTYRREWDHQQRISFGWWYLSGRMEPSTTDSVFLMPLKKSSTKNTASPQKATRHSITHHILISQKQAHFL
ncbi:hypothetical protein [Metabacillus sp. cB07]|uniref:hypothetical protein n=1 Tax=Metabacillus sp. cB07 TaxID=2806989 RepID=UPI001939C237|nr:hypothetical protein [Metabacillus sp. cB07]